MKRDENIKIKGSVKITMRNVDTGEIVYQTVSNLITTAGKVSMASALRGLTSNNQGIITYCAVGTDATAPDSANTTLGTELGRKLVSVRSSASNVATFQTFFTTNEVNGTLKEAGLFGDDASGTVDTGTLFAHTAIDRTKTSSDTLTFEWTITIG
jgi:hypothetical protein